MCFKIFMSGPSLAKVWRLSNVGTPGGPLQSPSIPLDQLSAGSCVIFLLLLNTKTSFPSVHNTKFYHSSLLLWLHSRPSHENWLCLLMSLQLVPVEDHAHHLSRSCTCHLSPCPLARVCHSPDVWAEDFKDFNRRLQRGQVNIGSSPLLPF